MLVNMLLEIFFKTMRRLPNHLLCLLLVTFSYGGEIVIKGSDTMGAKLVPQWAELYAKSNPKITFSIQAEGTSSCFRSLLDGACDIGIASRPPTEEELTQLAAKKISWGKRTVGYAMTAIIVYRENPISNVSLLDLEKIYTGQVTDWQSFGGRGKIAAYSPNSASGIYSHFQRVAMRGKPYQNNIMFLEHASIAQTFGASNEKGQRAIAYVNVAHSGHREIKSLSVNGLTPTHHNAKTYPLTRELCFFYRIDVSKEAKDFIDWVCSTEAAYAMTERIGFTSIRKVDEAELSTPPQHQKQ
jgi:phosphate transport system substrate-binding protein